MDDNPKETILVVDDEEWVRTALDRLLTSNGYSVKTIGDGNKAIKAIEKGGFDMVILDQKIEDVNGIDLLKCAKSRNDDPEVLLITAYGTVESAVEAIKLGAFDYLMKPLDSKRILLTVRQALERQKLRGEVKHLKKQIGETYGRRNLVFTDAKMKRIVELIDVVSHTDSTVLIEGENGTGKEIIARAIHFDGPRCKKPFITVNCGSIPEPLFESELFGHVKGSFTGASQDKPGLLEEAQDGTVLLDEIGDMPLPVQVKLLRVLQNGEFRRVGSNTIRTINVRIIASTNKNLRELIEDGSFREDLFYRLNVVPLKVPPLRDRKADIVALVNHFIEKSNNKLKKHVKGFLPESFELLMEYNWPGNVRELENLIERTITFSFSEYVTYDELLQSMNLERKNAGEINGEKTKEAFGDASAMLETQHIKRILQEYDWDRSAAAAYLGISRTTLWRKMKQYGIQKPD